ncbi:MAG: class I fructose-bisphosphate aldolase [Myxococcota bacterium]|nr:class I fructose-bisphosphate aldolase [Myxococcota bacterium]
MAERVSEILSWYAGSNPGVLTNLSRMMNHGRLAGSGKMVILPVDQGFEHGPARSFAKNPDGFDPRYHAQLAIDAGCSAYAAPLGFLEAVASTVAGQVPLILKMNNNESLYKSADPCSSVTSTVEDALRLGCTAVGFTVYPGSAHKNTLYEQIRELSSEARAVGLPTVLWCYPRGEQLEKKDETAVDVVAYAAQIGCQLGAHIVKVKPPTAHVAMKEARKVFESEGIPIATLEDRVRHVVRSAFGGRRIVIFSGGAAKGTEDVLKEVRGIAGGGGFGSIMGRNAFQRPNAEAIALLHSVMDIFAEV